jgi:hypothetical protein
MTGTILGFGPCYLRANLLSDPRQVRNESPRYSAFDYRRLSKNCRFPKLYRELYRLPFTKMGDSDKVCDKVCGKVRHKTVLP